MQSKSTGLLPVNGMIAPKFDADVWMGFFVAVAATDVLAGTFVGVFVAVLPGTLVGVWEEVGVAVD